MTNTIDNNTIDVEDLIEVHVPRHTVGADIRREGTDLGPPIRIYLAVWCSCGWKGDKLMIPFGPEQPFDPADIPAEVIEEAARSWRFHVRLSNRLYRTDRRLRRQAARAREEKE